MRTFWLALLGLILLLPLQAQNKDRDVQALLSNDDAGAALRQQLAARQITNVEYARQSQELVAARRAILSHYDRQGQRDLTALYNAAAKDRRASALDAKRKADADARAQAAAEAQAKKDAAVAAQRQAADEAAAEVARGIEEDAQEYTRLSIRHDELLHKLNWKNINGAEKQEMSGLRAKGDEIKRKYAAGGASQRQATAFQKRLLELAAEKVAPARQAWLAADFPDAGAIVANYSDDSQRLAALSLIDTLLWEQAGQPQQPATAEKIAGYRAAMAKLNPKDGPRHVALMNDQFKLTHNLQFRSDVISKFAPEFAAGPLRELKEAQAAEVRRAANQKSNAVLVGMGLIILALPVLYLVRGERKLAGVRDRHPDPNYPFQLPEHLSVIRVFRKWIRLDFDCGQIYDRTVWTETVTTHYYRSGQTYEINGTLYTTPGSYGSSTTSVTYYKYSYRTPDGRETWSQFAGDIFPAAVGQVMSTIQVGDLLLLAYNHSDGKFLKLTSGIAPAVAMKSRVVWCACLGVAAVGTAVLYFLVLPGTHQEGNADRAAFAVPVVLGVLSGMYVLAVKIFVMMARRSSFRLRWLPKLREFMEGRTAYLKQVYTLGARGW